MSKKKKSRDIIKYKSPTQSPIRSFGGIDYSPPSSGRYLVKNDDDVSSKKSVEDLIEFISLVIKDVI